MSLPRVKGDGTVLPVHNEKQPAHATPDGSTSSNTVAADSAGRANGFKQLLNGDIDPAKALGPLLAYCFATGFTGSIVFSACFIWVPFQTGNTIQLSIALARIFSGPRPRPQGFHTPDAQALTSLLSFLFGSFLGRFGDRVGSKKRWYLVLSTFLQGLFVLGAALSIHWSNDSGPIANPDSRAGEVWTDALGFVAIGFASASVGLQSITAKRLGTALGTCVVLTTTLTELVTEPSLFKLGLAPARDDRFMAIAFLFAGGLTGRAVTAESSSAVALGVAAAVRVIIAASWLIIPEKAAVKKA